MQHAAAQSLVLHSQSFTEHAVQDLCCVVSTLASLQEVGFNADVQGCLVAAKQQLQHRFQQGRDVSVPTLCQVCLLVCGFPGHWSRAPVWAQECTPEMLQTVRQNPWTLLWVRRM